MATIGVFATIFDKQSRVLCVHQNYGLRLWTTPGGKLEDGEEPVAGLRREIHEEVGLVVQDIQLVGVYAAPFKDDLVLGFRANCHSCEVRVNPDELSAADFFSLDELPSPMKRNTLLRIRDASEINVPVMLRSYLSSDDHGYIIQNGKDVA